MLGERVNLGTAGSTQVESGLDILTARLRAVFGSLAPTHTAMRKQGVDNARIIELGKELLCLVFC